MNNALAITADKISAFAEAFLEGEAEPHLKSMPALRENPTDQGTIFSLVGENFLDTVNSHNVLIKYYAPWCGHCKKLEPIYKDLAAKYNIPNSDVLIAKFDATMNDVPLEVTDLIQGFPTLKFHRKSATGSVHYAGDRNLDTLIEFIETHRGGDDASGAGDSGEVPHREEL